MLFPSNQLVPCGTTCCTKADDKFRAENYPNRLPRKREEPPDYGLIEFGVYLVPCKYSRFCMVLETFTVKQLGGGSDA